MDIHYIDSPVSIYPHQLKGFFVGWQNPPTPEKHHEVLRKSDYCVIAVDEDKDNQVVGFITAITDHVLTAYISLLEVLPEYQKHGIGEQLVKRLFAKVGGLYTVDMLCQPELVPYFEGIGMNKAAGVVLRNDSRQAGL